MSQESERSKDFLRSLCRDISLTRIKKHSFMDMITQKDAKRRIETDVESQWISVIFVRGDDLKFSFKTQFVTEDARHFASQAYGKKEEKMKK